MNITKFHVGIEYTADKCFKKFADEVSDARRAGDVDKEYELIAETMKLFGNSAYGKIITNKEGFVSTTYATEENINKKIKNPRFKNLEELYEYENLIGIRKYNTNRNYTNRHSKFYKESQGITS